MVLNFRLPCAFCTAHIPLQDRCHTRNRAAMLSSDGQWREQAWSTGRPCNQPGQRCPSVAFSWRHSDTNWTLHTTPLRAKTRKANHILRNHPTACLIFMDEENGNRGGSGGPSPRPGRGRESDSGWDLVSRCQVEMRRQFGAKEKKIALLLCQAREVTTG